MLTNLIPGFVLSGTVIKGVVSESILTRHADKLKCSNATTWPWMEGTDVKMQQPFARSPVSVSCWLISRESHIMGLNSLFNLDILSETLAVRSDFVNQSAGDWNREKLMRTRRHLEGRTRKQQNGWMLRILHLYQSEFPDLKSVFASWSKQKNKNKKKELKDQEKKERSSKMSV